MKSILLVSKEQDTISSFRKALEKEYTLETYENLTNALKFLEKTRSDLVFIDLELLDLSGQEDGYSAGLQTIWGLSAASDVIVITPQEKIRQAVKVLRAGAGDYITFPVQGAEIKHVIKNTTDRMVMRAELEYLRNKFWQTNSFEIVYTKNPEMKKVFERIRLVSPTKTTVLLMGETGTGKGVLARLIHQQSNRKDNQFISVHCGAIPETLIESELFGHEKGAFTGAIRQKLGKFEIAHGGTIFLDEIGTLTANAQIKLLQVLQEGIIQRVGSEKSLSVDVRVISASNEDLKTMCEQGRFRKDLYYRLSAFPIEVPNLRKRSEDIPALAEFFLKRLDRMSAKGIYAIQPDMLEAFKRYSWPGNIRELENILEQAYILGKSHVLTREDFPGEIACLSCPSPRAVAGGALTIADVRRNAVEAAERAYLIELLTRHQGRIKKVSEEAGITTRQLSKLLSKCNLHKENFRPPRTPSRRQEP